MKRNKIIILTLIILVFVVGGLVYNYTFNTKHRNISVEEATVSMSAENLYNHFYNNEKLATTKYLDKVIEIEGKITSVENNEIILNDKIQVSFNIDKMPKVAEQILLTIKGRCVGYDELLEVVKIDQATVINKQN
ncbi:OB-fold protein [Algibacter aquimarinus]|uniref:tRNA_anti-like n=1 Tax=Algibacter aquimarinus TaxID=1136748 RepID=A0ABP9HBR3_9FLAO